MKKFMEFMKACFEEYDDAWRKGYITYIPRRY